MGRIPGSTAKPLVRALLDHPEQIADVEAAQAPRWVWADTARHYPALLRAGVRVARCHDLAATERLLLAHEQRWDDLAALPAPWTATDAEPTLLDALDPVNTGRASNLSDPEQLLTAHAQHQERIVRAGATHPGFALLVAAESAGWLAATEMALVGLPWDVQVHDQLLTAVLGDRPGHGRPPKLAELARELAQVLEDPTLNPDSQPDLLRSLRRAGLPVRSTSRWELARHDHPAVALVRRYKEMSRLWTANGWAWAQTWVQDGRFHPEYVPGGVVSGRWATRGGGALQIPRSVRDAVRAVPGRVLIVADAGQLEPRVLAAMSGDPAMVAATRVGDLYRELAEQALGGAQARDQAKIALLSAMYGGGAGSPGLAALRRRFPTALSLLEQAARRGEDGLGVHSVLGRAAPPAREGWLNDLPEDAARSASRSRGRFTRNFVVQASAADWAAVLVAGLRTRLHQIAPDDGWTAQLVFFQHDEVMVEATTGQAAAVLAAVESAGLEATRLVLGPEVAIPLNANVLTSYADKG